MASPFSLDKIGEVINSIVLWWGRQVAHIAPDKLPIYAYLGFSLLALVLWWFVARLLPKTLAGLSWIILFAILLTPTTSLGTSPQIAPASIGVIYGILLKDSAIIFNSLLPMLVVVTVGCVMGFLWQLLKFGLERTANKKAMAVENDTPSSSL